MDTYVDGELISDEEREKLWLENLDNPVPGVDGLYHNFLNIEYNGKEWVDKDTKQVRDIDK